MGWSQGFCQTSSKALGSPLQQRVTWPKVSIVWRPRGPSSLCTLCFLNTGLGHNCACIPAPIHSGLNRHLGHLKGHIQALFLGSLFFLFGLWQAAGNKEEVSYNIRNGIRDPLERKAWNNFCIEWPQKEWKGLTISLAKGLMGNEWLDSPGNPFVLLIHSLTGYRVHTACQAPCCCWGYGVKDEVEQGSALS